MGETIRKSAAAADIKKDVDDTLFNAAAKGDLWKSLAEERLGPAMTVLAKVDTDLAIERELLRPLDAILSDIDDDADRLLGEIAEDLWASIGRPAADPCFSLLFPGGVIFYTDGEDECQPDRMILLAELLEVGVHPKLDPDLAQAAAGKVRAKAAEYTAALQAAHGPRSRIKLLEKICGAVVRTAQMELVKLKRRYLAEGFSEAEVHEVIPDRPASKAPREP
jgi:hypothetical protein